MKAPSLFLSHGAPTLLFERGQYYRDLTNYTKSINKPDNIVVISAHWQDYSPIQVSYFDVNPLIYDFYGFPEELYQFKYQSPGNLILSKKIIQLLRLQNIEAQLNPQRGLDHGTWVPLSIMYPEANIPVVQVSMPYPRNSSDLKKIGKMLSSLRVENTMVIGSGSTTHNLQLTIRNMQLQQTQKESWASEFDTWLKELLDTGSYSEIFDAPNLAPYFQVAHPTTEHFDPIYFTLGAASPDEGINQFHSSIQFGNMSMRSFATES